MNPEEKKLHDMQAKLQSRKEEVSELRGERNTLMKQLKDEGCKNVEEAEKLAASERKKAGELRGKLEEGIQELEENYEW